MKKGRKDFREREELRSRCISCRKLFLNVEDHLYKVNNYCNTYLIYFTYHLLYTYISEIRNTYIFEFTTCTQIFQWLYCTVVHNNKSK